LVKNNAKDNIIHDVKGIVSYMDSVDHTNLLPEFKKQISVIDEVRNEKFIEIYPELKIL